MVTQETASPDDRSPRVSDPFGTAALRESVLSSWRSSPTRLREDTNAEEDLVLGGYRDRLLIELAQNAADAAGTGGHLRVSLVDGELRVANTGQPLTRQGVESLASLRASAKDHGVGRFGVGFAAVLTVSDSPRMVSTAGGLPSMSLVLGPRSVTTGCQFCDLPGPPTKTLRTGSPPRFGCLCVRDRRWQASTSSPVKSSTSCFPSTGSAASRSVTRFGGVRATPSTAHRRHALDHRS